jgi:polyketide biosynthesis enoyl-CoA hydratase PksH
MAERFVRVPSLLGPEAVEDLHRVLDEVEADPTIQCLVLEGADGVFCQGMDFEQLLERGDEQDGLQRFPALLRRFSSAAVVVIAAVDGKAMAGGLGLVAAADLVLSSDRSTFSLSEALWGLLPCTIAPYLIRRTGFQAAYEMTLSARTVTAADAFAMRLVDSVVVDLDAQLRVTLRRLERLDSETVGDLKAFFAKMWLASPEMDRVALVELSRLLASPKVKKNISDYATLGRMPWEAW